jgi:hypothetical protein
MTDQERLDLAIKVERLLAKIREIADVWCESCRVLREEAARKHPDGALVRVCDVCAERNNFVEKLFKSGHVWLDFDGTLEETLDNDDEKDEEDREEDVFILETRRLALERISFVKSIAEDIRTSGQRHD